MPAAGAVKVTAATAAAQRRSPALLASRHFKGSTLLPFPINPTQHAGSYILFQLEGKVSAR
jgi:hypothetical protein